MYSVFLYLISCHKGEPATPKTIKRRKKTPKPAKNQGAPAKVTMRSKKIENPKANTIPAKPPVDPEKRNAILTGLLLHNTLSLGLRYLRRPLLLSSTCSLTFGTLSAMRDKDCPHLRQKRSSSSTSLPQSGQKGNLTIPYRNKVLTLFSCLTIDLRLATVYVLAIPLTPIISASLQTGKIKGLRRP